MSQSSNPQNIQGLSAYESPNLNVTMLVPTNITGWTIQLNIRSEDEGTTTLLIQMTGPTITDNINGVFNFVLSSSQTGVTLGPGDFQYDIWRTDAGFEKRLTWGIMSILPEQWK